MDGTLVTLYGEDQIGVVVQITMNLAGFGLL